MNINDDSLSSIADALGCCSGRMKRGAVFGACSVNNSEVGV